MRDGVSMTQGDTPAVTRVTHGQIFTFAQAVEVTGKSRSTLHRKREMLRQAGAHQDAEGVWRIPVSALVACGLLDTPETSRRGVSDTGMRPPRETPQNDELEQLRRALSEAEKRAEVAEARAAERDRLIEVQSRTIALLEAHKAGTSEPRYWSEVEPEPVVAFRQQQAPSKLSSGGFFWRLFRFAGVEGTSRKVDSSPSV